MKGLGFTIFLAMIVLVSVIGFISGTFMMAYDLVVSGSEFLNGFIVFSLSSILFLVCIVSFIATQILTTTELLADVTSKFVLHEMEKERRPVTNPLTSLFGNLGNFGFPGSGTIKMGKIEEDGSFTPLGEKEFNTPEEFIKHRDEILGKAFNKKSDKKKFEDMSIQELESEEKTAVDKQEFELAVALRDLIKEKKEKS